MESVRTKFVCSREAPVGKSVHVHHFHTLLNSGSSIKAELQSKEEGGAEKKKDLLSIIVVTLVFLASSPIASLMMLP